MFHDSQAVLALSKEPNPTVFQKTLGVNDFYFSGPDFDYPMGNIQMIGKSQAEMFRGEKPLETKFAPEWVLGDVASHAVDFWLSTEDLPTPDNRVTLDKDANIHLSVQAEQPDRLGPPVSRQLKSMLKDTGHAPGPSGAPVRVHEDRHSGGRRGAPGRHGPVRQRSETSVLNSDCRAHEVDNLYVVDTSIFPSIGAVNPALTAMANALRVGDHLLQRLGAPAAVGGALPTAR